MGPAQTPCGQKPGLSQSDERLPVQRLHSSIAANSKGELMPVPAGRYRKLDQAMPYRDRPFRAFRPLIIVSTILLGGFAFGCGEASRGTNTNSPASSNQQPGNNPNSNAGSATAGSAAAIDIKEPERYSVAMTMGIQETSSEAPSPMLTQQFDLAKLEDDRRWSFVFPAPLGQIVYLEKSGLRYLVLFERKQYTEVEPNTFGFELRKVFMPTSISNRLRSHAYEKLGLEPVNGRTAIKYRLTASDSTTHMIFVDQETGLPLRFELSAVAPSGTKSRIVVEARDVQLNPDRAQFDVPVGMKKVSQQEARQQIEAFTSGLRPFSDIISGTASAPVGNVTQPASNKNAGRSAR
jgi:hypothetical protein